MPERQTIREAVADTLSNLGERTRNAVIETFAAKEAEKQANALVAGLNKLAELERDLNKVRPTFAGYDADGKGVGVESFSKEQIEQRKKLGEQIEKLTRSINKADDNADFGDLYNLTKSTKGNSDAEG